MEITNLYIRDLELVAPALKNLYSAIDTYKLVFRSAEFRLQKLLEKNKGDKVFGEESRWRGKVYEEVRDYEKKLEDAYREARMKCDEVGIVLPFAFDDLKYWVEHPAEDEWIREYGRLR